MESNFSNPGFLPDTSPGCMPICPAWAPGSRLEASPCCPRGLIPVLILKPALDLSLLFDQIPFISFPAPDVNLTCFMRREESSHALTGSQIGWSPWGPWRERSTVFAMTARLDHGCFSVIRFTRHPPDVSHLTGEFPTACLWKSQLPKLAKATCGSGEKRGGGSHARITRKYGESFPIFPRCHQDLNTHGTLKIRQ